MIWKVYAACLLSVINADDLGVNKQCPAEWVGGCSGGRKLMLTDDNTKSWTVNTCREQCSLESTCVGFVVWSGKNPRCKTYQAGCIAPIDNSEVVNFYLMSNCQDCPVGTVLDDIQNVCKREISEVNCGISALCAVGPDGPDCSYGCSCDTGYEQNLLLTTPANYNCKDIDECATGTDNCDLLATCSNTPGSFTCNCPDGYSSDNSGVNCTDIDECVSETDTCETTADCTNIPGSFTCELHVHSTGSEGSGLTNSTTEIDPVLKERIPKKNFIIIATIVPIVVVLLAIVIAIVVVKKKHAFPCEQCKDESAQITTENTTEVQTEVQIDGIASPIAPPRASLKMKP